MNVRSADWNAQADAHAPCYMMSSGMGSRPSSYPSSYSTTPGGGMTAYSSAEAGGFLQPHQATYIGRHERHALNLPAAQQYASAAADTLPQHPAAMPASYNTSTTDDCPQDDMLRSVRELPAAFHPIFSYRYFNAVQSECFDVAYKTDINMVISAPTGAGKTGVMELAMLRLFSKHLQPRPDSNMHQQFKPTRGSQKIVYIGPIKALVQERHQDWRARYGCLGLKVVQLTGDVDHEQLDDELEDADIICTTPEKFDQTTRKLKEKGRMDFFAQLSLVLLDEVHLLNEAGRGSSLEAGCVCRVKAVAAVPEMAKAPIASVRFVAVSATIPNIQDLAKWLNVPPTGTRQYGDELRPCKLTTHVKRYNPAKNDFLFERRLNEYVFAITTSYSNGRPALVFCNSRKGTSDTAAIIAREATRQCSSSTGSMLVKTMQQLERLQAAAARAKAKDLSAALVAGVGFHNAAMEPEDRDLVEGLFKSSNLQVLCTTSTLAMGVNLPAHLVVVKGTKRYVGESETAPGEPAGYKEYTHTEVLQMVGRAGRPQFDNEGVAVIMTNKDSTYRYQKMMAGQAVESCLMVNLAEHLNAELVLGTIQDVPGAIQWLKSSFLYTRVRSNPQHYGLGSKLHQGMCQAEVDSIIKEQLIMQPVSQLLDYGLATTDEDSYTLTSTKAGKLMANHFLKLQTMAAIVKLGERPNMPSLLRVICGAEEFKKTALRRCEKKMLNSLNHSSDPQQLRYHVMAAQERETNTGKFKERLTSPQEKLFVLLNDGLADKLSESLDYSLKQEQERLLLVGQRIAKCMARYYVERNSYSAAGRSLLLARSLRAKLWDDSQVEVRQLQGVGKLLAGRLSAAGLGSFKALMMCNDAHQIEVAAQKPYPWGSELLAQMRSIVPPPTSMQLQVLERLPRGAVMCQMTLSRIPGRTCQDVLGQQMNSLTPAGGLVTATGADAPSAGSAQADRDTCMEAVACTYTPCKLLCGCSNTDQLLLCRSVVLETFESPLQISFRVESPADASEPINISARLVLDRFIGLDEKTSLTIPSQSRPAAVQQFGSGHTAKASSSAVPTKFQPQGISQGAAGESSHAAAAVAQINVTGTPGINPGKRTLANKTLSCDGSVHDTAPAAAGTDAVKRQRRHKGLNPALQAEPLLQAQLHQRSDSRQPYPAKVASTRVMGAVMTQQSLPQAMQIDERCDTVTLNAQSTSHKAPSQPMTAIAARYNSIRNRPASSTGSLQEQTAAACCTRGRSTEGLSAISVDGAVAVEAGRLQITPEHQQHTQQTSTQPEIDHQQHAIHHTEQAAWDGSTEQSVLKPQVNGAHASAAQGSGLKRGSLEQLHMTEARSSDLDASGGLGIAAMFDLLADDHEFCPQVYDQQEQSAHSSAQQTARQSTHQQTLLLQQQPCRLTASTVATRMCSAPCTAAAAMLAPSNISLGGASSAAVNASSAARSASAVHGPAVPDSRQATAAPMSDTQNRSCLSAVTRAGNSSNVISWQRSDTISRPVGAGADPTRSSHHRNCRIGINTPMDMPQHMMPPTGPSKPIPAPDLQLQVPLVQHQCLGQRDHHTLGSEVSQLSAATAAANKAPGSALSLAGVATLVSTGVDDLSTPPRQIIRSSLAGSCSYPERRSASQCSNTLIQLQQQQRLGSTTQDMQTRNCIEGSGCDASPQQAAAVPALNRFAFVPAPGQTATATAYRPSQNSTMFDRNSGLQAACSSQRALAQAKLGGKQLKTSRSNISIPKMVHLKQSAPATGSRFCSSTRSTLSSRTYGTAPCIASAMQAPAAPKVQWQGFVDHPQQHGRLQPINQARDTWRATASMHTNDMSNGRQTVKGLSAAEHRVADTYVDAVQIAKRPSASRSGMLETIPKRFAEATMLASPYTQCLVSTELEAELASAETPRRNLVADGPLQNPASTSRSGECSARLQVNLNSGSTSVPTGNHCLAADVAAEPDLSAQRDAAAEQTGVQEDTQCLDFAGIFDFMKS